LAETTPGTAATATPKRMTNVEENFMVDGFVYFFFNEPKHKHVLFHAVATKKVENTYPTRFWDRRVFK
jgi:hypothetical protein